ncbi:MAG TPA: thioredoxin domain-containing protein, partial [Candidatus Methylacidiphilales bacterium]|nr:thioredoxin domain-containing protein [Candidatus Methylacidiphilales bacterium]
MSQSFTPHGPGAAKPKHTNRLAGEKSPYLLQHAHNPVDWYPWGEEAFARARDEKKVIFLSVGYSTCHWCHVMERESFENENVARVMNEYFVNIKVDREERPDVDRVYMYFVQSTTGHGGWPMSVWLTPDLKPIVGGTYFPPVDAYGRMGFGSVLKKIAGAWQSTPERVAEQGESMLTALRQELTSQPEDGTALEVGIGTAPAFECMSKAFGQLARSFDDAQGGFGRAPKFPRPSTLIFLHRYAARHRGAGEKGAVAIGMSLYTLRKMAAGGMHDHLGGGFHRYSVDEFWHVPHFEKMLYDQGQLVVACLEAFQFTRDADFERIVRSTLTYLQRDMTSPDGAFYSAEDADSLVEAGGTEKAEGAFYVWTREEIERALTQPEAAIIREVYGVLQDGNTPEGSDPHGEFRGKNVLIWRMNAAEAAGRQKLKVSEADQVLAAASEKLRAMRLMRPRPHLDDKIITAWNALAISGFARASQVLGDTDYLRAAGQAAAFVRMHLYDEETGALYRSYREGRSNIEGFADDFAFFIQALLDLYEASGDVLWLEWAVELQERMDKMFLDHEHGGYFTSSGRDAAILLRMKEDYDGAEPSPNSVAALNLLRLAAMLNRPDWQEQAERVLQSCAKPLRAMPTALPQMLAALDFAQSKPIQIVIALPPAADGGPVVGAELHEVAGPLLAEIHRTFLPNKVILFADGGEGQEYLAEGAEFLASVTPINGKATVYVCRDFTCQLPVTEPADLRNI